ncbi:AI-2E family transporter [Kocuria sp. WRN011]|nr:AI-2E family transporter [Kocuria sp. WRN011]
MTPGAAPAPRRAPWDKGLFAGGHPVQTGFFLTLGVGIALLGFYVLTNVGSLAGWVVTAAFIALGLDPIVRWLEARGLPRPLAVSAVILALALAMTAFIVLVVPRMVNQAQQFMGTIPQLVNQFMGSSFFEALDERFNIAATFEQTVASWQTQLSTNQDLLGGMFGSVVSVGGVVINAVTGTIIVMALSLYFLFSLPMAKAWGYRLAPASRRARVQRLGDQMINGVGNYVVGQACVAVINASVAFILMTVTGVPYATLLVLFVAVLAFIPLVGGVLAGILVTLFAILGGWDTVLPFALCYFAYLQIEAYFVSPRIMKRAVAVPGAVAVIAVAAGGALWGILGAVIAIPTAAAGLLLVREVFVPRQDAR